MTDTLYLLDTHGVCVWLFHKHAAEPRERNGERCEMLDAFYAWAMEFLGHFEPGHIAACLEGRKNWRKEVASGGCVSYKANRKAADAALAQQLNMVPALLAELGIACVRDESMEADDLIATLAARHESELPVVVISSDKDLSQLITAQTTMFAPVPDKAGERHHYDVAGWTAKAGIAPHRMREFLALLGDSSDNVAGVPGWGKVNATNAIAQTKSWPEIVRKARAGQLQKITTKNQAALIDNLETFALAYKLVGLRYDANVPDLGALVWRDPSAFGNSAEQPAAESDAETGTGRTPAAGTSVDA